MKVIQKDQHSVSITDISNNALKVVDGLRVEGHKAYIVGGAVRDLLLGGVPKDFDVATNATPEEIRSIFKFSRIIGRRFRIAHIRFDREIIEVTTFRGHHKIDVANSSLADSSQHSAKGILLRDNVFGPVEEDAVRRDFTINALYYDPESSSIIDYTGGLEDLQERKIKVIGDPITRFREDPIRILRAIRFANKIDFKMDPSITKAIPKSSRFLSDIPPARMFDEWMKIFLAGSARANLDKLIHHSLLDYFFPNLKAIMEKEPKWTQLIKDACSSTDLRISHRKSVTPSFLLAAMLWPQVATNTKEIVGSKGTSISAITSASSNILRKSNSVIAIPKRFSTAMREIWKIQCLLESTRGKNPKLLIEQRWFRASYDLLLLREAVTDCRSGLGKHWSNQQNLYKKKPKTHESNRYHSRVNNGRGLCKETKF